MQREQKKKERKTTTKKVDLVSKTITLHLHHNFWYIFCRFFYVDYHVKFPNFTEDVNKLREIFLSLLKFGLNRAVRIRLREHCGTFVML